MAGTFYFSVYILYKSIPLAKMRSLDSSVDHETTNGENLSRRGEDMAAEFFSE